jgi:hypothetical protein
VVERSNVTLKLSLGAGDKGGCGSVSQVTTVDERHTRCQLRAECANKTIASAMGRGYAHRNGFNRDNIILRCRNDKPISP